uniref:Band 7 domain-containing protein n=1 Tax=Calcidiscus leptoporus TaxID=127549 RepID=A0A7S0NMF0_9EUKA|mmetsp:Transcript_1075/g.2452  ORF Transcript_1075/g.2452 Transcript_1075/m.2452 type:complete len:304 (+) Transcript_1075:93-1004(+)
MSTCFCCACVSNDELAAVESCGQFAGIKEGGCHVLGCAYLGCGYSMKKISTRIQENEVRCETKTSDDVFVTIKVSVQQEVIKENAYDAIYKLTNPHKQIESYVANVVRGEVPKMKLDDVFTQKEELAKACRLDVEAKMKEFGFFIHNVLVTDIEPAAIVKNAMNEKDANRRLREAAVDKGEAEKTLREKKAEADANAVVKAAQADAEAKYLAGQGIARQRSAIIDGLKASLGAAESEISAERVTELLLITQYFDTLEKMSNGKATTVFLPHAPGGLSDLAEQMRNGMMQGAAGAAPMSAAMTR